MQEQSTEHRSEWVSYCSHLKDNGINCDCDPDLQAVVAENERLRETLRLIWTYLHSTAPSDHHRMGEACGEDLCILCLAEATAKEALIGGPSDSLRSGLNDRMLRSGGSVSLPSGESHAS